MRARVSARVGVMRNRSGDALEGRIGSLIKSLIPSAIGCRSPYGPTTFGPFRSCIYPSTFRSNSVRNATASNTGIMYANGLMTCVKIEVIA